MKGTNFRVKINNRNHNKIHSIVSIMKAIKYLVGRLEEKLDILVKIVKNDKP